MKEASQKTEPHVPLTVTVLVEAAHPVPTFRFRVDELVVTVEESVTLVGWNDVVTHDGGGPVIDRETEPENPLTPFALTLTEKPGCPSGIDMPVGETDTEKLWMISWILTE